MISYVVIFIVIFTKLGLFRDGHRQSVLVLP